MRKPNYKKYLTNTLRNLEIEIYDITNSYDLLRDAMTFIHQEGLYGNFLVFRAKVAEEIYKEAVK